MYWGAAPLAALVRASRGASPSTSSTRATSPRSRPRSAPAATKLVWLETPANPTWAISRHRGRRRARPPGRRPPCGRRHRRDAGAHPAARARRRPGHALGDQVPERPHRRGRRRAGHRPGRRPLGADRRAPPRRRRDPRALRGLAAAARHAHAVPARRARLGDRPVPRRAPAARIRTSQPCSTPACPTTPATRSPRRQMQGGFGGMLSIRVRRRSGRDRDRRARRDLAARDLARRRREPDRAPRLDRGPDLAGAPRPAPPLGRHRARPRICSPTSSRRCTKAPRNHRDRRADRLWWGSADPIKTTRLRSFGGRTDDGQQSKLQRRGMAAAVGKPDGRGDGGDRGRAQRPVRPAQGKLRRQRLARQGPLGRRRQRAGQGARSPSSRPPRAGPPRATA